LLHIRLLLACHSERMEESPLSIYMVGGPPFSSFMG
jgi:hypothetical protein